MENLFPPETTIYNEAEHGAAQKRLCESSKLVNSDLPALGRAFVGDADSFATIHRYESGLERSLFKALHELPPGYRRPDREKMFPCPLRMQVCSLQKLRERGFKMPLVQIKLIEGVVSEEQKREMLTKVTDAVLSVEGEAVRPYTLVTIEEVKSGDWGVGGKLLGTEEVKAIIADKKSKAA